MKAERKAAKAARREKKGEAGKKGKKGKRDWREAKEAKKKDRGADTGEEKGAAAGGAARPPHRPPAPTAPPTAPPHRSPPPLPPHRPPPPTPSSLLPTPRPPTPAHRRAGVNSVSSHPSTCGQASEAARRRTTTAARGGRGWVEAEHGLLSSNQRSRGHALRCTRAAFSRVHINAQPRAPTSHSDSQTCNPRGPREGEQNPYRASLDAGSEAAPVMRAAGGGRRSIAALAAPRTHAALRRLSHNAVLQPRGWRLHTQEHTPWPGAHKHRQVEKGERQRRQPEGSTGSQEGECERGVLTRWIARYAEIRGEMCRDCVHSQKPPRRKRGRAADADAATPASAASSSEGD